MMPTCPALPAATQLKIAVPLVVPGIGASLLQVTPAFVDRANTTCFPPAGCNSSDATHNCPSRPRAALGSASVHIRSVPPGTTAGLQFQVIPRSSLVQTAVVPA